MTGTNQVLIIDDALFMRELVKDALAGLFDAYLEAPDRETGLALIGRHRPRVVTLDLSLDSENPVQGLELLRDFRAAAWDSAVIVISALDQDWIRREIIALGGAGYFRKPFERDELRQRVKSILEDSHV